MKKEQLLSAGLTEELATAVLKIHKDEIDGSYIPKHRFDDVNHELKTTKESLADRDKQIAELKKFEGDAQALQDKIKQLEDDNKKKDTEYQSKMAFESKKNAVRMALLEDENGKPHDTDMVLGLFNLDNIITDATTGKIVSGFKEQNESIRKEKAFLFGQKEQGNPGDNNGGTGFKFKGTNPADGDGGKGPDTAESYGKSLAAIKLGMMGVQTDSGSNE